MKLYVTESTPSGVEVLVEHSQAPGDSLPLQPAPGYSGQFEWGYHGAGPRALAYAILADLLPGRFGDAFMEDVISKVSPIEKHERVVVIHEKAVLDWLQAKLGQAES